MKINKLNFFKNIINIHFKASWKLILFFAIFSFICTFLTLSLVLIASDIPFKYLISINSLTYVKDSATSVSGTNLLELFNYVLFGGPTILFFTIFSLVLINKYVIKEINNGRISFWMTMPISRKIIFYSKISYIIFELWT